LLAAPGFEAWTQGEPLSVQDLLYEKNGKPRIAVIAISHLSDAERMFFLSLLLSEVVAWTRAQSGTGSLRALVYIDELFGFLPPMAEPPTKRPLLTLLKQARAFGVGLALSTQNPVDLDYKALSNAGTWFIGRLQTERDVDRLLNGLASSTGGTDVAALADSIAGLPKRTFVLHNVHEREPVIFQTRWVMSYLAGPLSRDQIRRLSRPSEGAGLPPEGSAETGQGPSQAAENADAGGEPRPKMAAAPARPFLPPHVEQAFLGPAAAISDHGESGSTRYFPFLLAVADVHYSSKTHAVEHDERVARLVEPLEATVPVDWGEGEAVVVDLNTLARQPREGVSFAGLPKVTWDDRAVKSWQELFERWLRTAGALQLLRSEEHKLSSRPGEDEREFRLRCAQAAREARDERKSALRKRYGSKLDTLERRILRDEQAVGRERQQLQHRTFDTVGSLVGAIFGGRRATTVISSAIRKASSGSKDLGDVKRAQESLARSLGEKAELEIELENELRAVEALTVRPEEIELQAVSVKPSSRDVVIRYFGLAWVAHRLDDGRWTAVAEL
ncbi:MAG TPA: hypothetical protein VFD39_05095, partial [Trueperaceae bacterium]|nr:hypothetical protein [Trueperaceae bacterium]